MIRPATEGDLDGPSTGLTLWVFETNVDARRFYRDHGFVEVERTDGSANEERSPDVRYAWPGPA